LLLYRNCWRRKSLPRGSEVVEDSGFLPVGH
jgi:hypothetical protein